jgi:hypothetical protein
VHALGGEEAVMGRMQREKGKRFERAVAAELRKRWPDAVVRRSSQAERAYQSDVFIEGGPPLLSRLWLELQDARNPTPLAKLEQAERDIATTRRGDALAVVIWHRLGARECNVTMRLRVLDVIRQPIQAFGYYDQVSTMTLGDFIGVLEKCHPNRCMCTYEVGSGSPVCTCWFGNAQAKKEAA